MKVNLNVEGKNSGGRVRIPGKNGKWGRVSGGGSRVDQSTRGRGRVGGGLHQGEETRELNCTDAHWLVGMVPGP